MKVYVDCVGCEQRQLDAQQVIDYVKANGIEMVDAPSACDLAIMVTCAVDQASEDKSVEMIEHVSGKVPKTARLVVGGCLPSITPSRLTLYNIHATFSPRNMKTLQQIIGLERPLDIVEYPNRSSFDSTRFVDLSKMDARQDYEAAKNGFKIRIDHGCLLQCSYCAIRLATAKLKSEDPEVVKRQVKRAVALGEKTIMLVGGDTGAYGYDIGTRLCNLLELILAIPGDFKVYIHDFNINWLLRDEKEFLAVFASENGKKLGSVSFPVQSGSNRMLKLMKRPYTSENVVRVLSEIRRIAPHIRFGTHIIVGFPGETEEDFQDTLKMMDEVNFDFATCFSFSERAPTYAAELDGKISKEVTDNRLAVLNERYKDRVNVIR